MLKHYIILPLENYHFFDVKMLLQKDIECKILFDDNFILSKANENGLEKFGKEVVSKSFIFGVKNKEQIPLALHQLKLIDFTCVDSVHLVGTKKQLEFLNHIIKLANLKIDIFFTSTKQECQKEILGVKIYEDIFTQKENFEVLFLEYLNFIQKNVNVKARQENKISFKTKARIVLAHNDELSLCVNDKVVIKTVLKISKENAFKNYVEEKLRKLRKLRNNPALFMIDFILKRVKN